MYYFIINPHSKTGKAKIYWMKLKKILDENTITYKAFISKKAGDATSICAKICQSYPGIKKIIIVGGDGTANEVINGLSDFHNVLLGYIPLGSSNDLARGLQLPKDPCGALDLILHPVRYRYVDQGITTVDNSSQSYRFAVSSGIGYDAAVCGEALTSPLKKILNHLHIGKLIYFLIAVKQVFTHTQTEAEIIIDQQNHIYTKHLVFMASLIHKYEGGGLKMAPDAKDNDHKLEVCLVSDLSRIKLLFMMPTILFGKHTSIKGVHMISCREISIKTKQPMVVHTDGEIIGLHREVTFTCAPEQIRMYSL